MNCNISKINPPPSARPFPFFGDDKSTVACLRATLPQTNTLDWIGQCPMCRELLVTVSKAELKIDSHLLGDHTRPTAGSKRQATLIQH